MRAAPVRDTKDWGPSALRGRAEQAARVHGASMSISAMFLGTRGQVSRGSTATGGKTPWVCSAATMSRPHVLSAH